jgi:DNA-binding transcriptional ArsR family regulator
MVKYDQHDLDFVFGSLADSTRRDILERLIATSLSVNEIYEPYSDDMSLPALSKHLKVLERADLIKRTKLGRTNIVSINPKKLQHAKDYFEYYSKFWTGALDNLEEYLRKGGER